MKMILPHGEHFTALKAQFKPPISQEERVFAHSLIVGQRQVDTKLYLRDSSQGFNWNPDHIDVVAESDIIAQVTHDRGLRVMETEMVEANAEDTLPTMGGVIGRYDSPYDGSFDVVLVIGNGDINRVMIRELGLAIEISNRVDTFGSLADVIHHMIHRRLGNGRIG